MKVTIPDTVLSTELQDEGVLLNLETGEYFGLDAVGLDMWRALAAEGSVEAARRVARSVRRCGGHPESRPARVCLEAGRAQAHPAGR